MLTKLEPLVATGISHTGDTTDAGATPGDENPCAGGAYRGGLRYNRHAGEINRLVADHCSDRLYAPTPQAMRNLESENLEGRAVLTGDVMLDAVLRNIDLAQARSRALDELGMRNRKFGLVTVHRPVNTDGDALKPLLATLEATAKQLELLFPVHPRTRAALDAMRYKAPKGLRLVGPLPYLDTILLIQNAAVVITDSGGVQKEAAFLHTPCLTMRDETEWTETVDMGVNRLVGNAASGGLTEAVAGVLHASDPFGAKTR
jgi:UDP-N-acetylglucosamine 2-epimerase